MPGGFKHKFQFGNNHETISPWQLKTTQVMVLTARLLIRGHTRKAREAFWYRYGSKFEAKHGGHF